jgi:hypothetical protein
MDSCKHGLHSKRMAYLLQKSLCCLLVEMNAVCPSWFLTNIRYLVAGYIMCILLHLSHLAKWEHGEHENTIWKRPVRMMFQNVEVK